MSGCGGTVLSRTSRRRSRPPMRETNGSTCGSRGVLLDAALAVLPLQQPAEKKLAEFPVAHTGLGVDVADLAGVGEGTPPNAGEFPRGMDADVRIVAARGEDRGKRQGLARRRRELGQ